MCKSLRTELEASAEAKVKVFLRALCSCIVDAKNPGALKLLHFRARHCSKGQWLDHSVASIRPGSAPTSRPVLCLLALPLEMIQPFVAEFTSIRKCTLAVPKLSSSTTRPRKVQTF